MSSFHVGEAVIDFTSTGELRFQGSCGGSSLNTAIAVARLGQRAGYITQLSTDFFGQRLRHHIEEHGLDTRFLTSSSAPSTLAFVEHGETGNRYQFLANGSADFLYAPDPLPELPSETSMLQFGSVSLVFEPCAGSVESLVRAHRNRMIVLLDPNVRPTVIPDMDRYRAGFPRWLSLCHVLKLSDEDAALLSLRSLEEQMHDWLRLGPQAVLLTRGAKGARIYLKQGAVIDVPAPEVAIVDTVGAGDTFTAGVMTALMERAIHSPAQLNAIAEPDWQDIGRWACTAAALCCTRAGASPPTRAELARAILST